MTGTQGWEAYAQADPIRRAMVITAGRETAMGVQYLRGIDETGPQLGDSTEGEPPRLVLPEGLARALFAALLEQFGGPGADRELRADYVAERARVDKLIEAAITPRVITYGDRAVPS